MVTYRVNSEYFETLPTGMGRSALELARDAEHGANVAVADWNEAAEGLIKPYPGRPLFRKCDVSNWENVLEVFEAAQTEFGIIHTVISNAGISSHENLLTAEVDPTTNRLCPPSHKSIEVNLIGELYVTKSALHYFAQWPATHCQLVVTSSAGAFFPAPPIYMYFAAMSGILGLKWLETRGDLPKNSALGVARALFLPVLNPTLNGKSLFVAGDRIFEFEDSWRQAERSWMGPELCDQVRRGRPLLLASMNPEC
ncbi:NAD(P)-binding protein [Aspergillus cavernicola]|uniref:NAD(P)-binding protein n=1 Tax=Aspergillus cavernicola TaxID=176166 RepID=A0ABR4IEX5_9EURO